MIPKASVRSKLQLQAYPLSSEKHSKPFLILRMDPDQGQRHVWTQGKARKLPASKGKEIRSLPQVMLSVTPLASKGKREPMQTQCCSYVVWDLMISFLWFAYDWARMSELPWCSDLKQTGKCHPPTLISHLCLVLVHFLLRDSLLFPSNRHPQ